MGIRMLIQVILKGGIEQKGARGYPNHCSGESQNLQLGSLTIQILDPQKPQDIPVFLGNWHHEDIPLSAVNDIGWVRNRRRISRILRSNLGPRYISTHWESIPWWTSLRQPLWSPYLSEQQCDVVNNAIVPLLQQLTAPLPPQPRCNWAWIDQGRI